MKIMEIVTRDDYPCDRCGKVSDVQGELPDGDLLCRECRGIFTCLCCKWGFGVRLDGREDYSGDPEKFVCFRCEDECQYDDEYSVCTHNPQRAGECRCPTRAGPIPKSCPKCGVCNHTNLPPLYQLEEGDIVNCGDCGQQIVVELLAFVSIPGTGLGLQMVEKVSGLREEEGDELGDA